MTDTLDGSLIFFLPYIEDRGPTKRTKNVLCMSSVTVFLLKKPEWGPPCIVHSTSAYTDSDQKKIRTAEPASLVFLKLGSVCKVTKKKLVVVCSLRMVVYFFPQQTLSRQIPA